MNKNNLPLKILRSIKKRIKNKEIFYDDIKFYFNQSYEIIITDYDLKSINEIPSFNNLINRYELIKPNLDEKIDFLSYRALDIKELYNLLNRKGFFFLPGGGIEIYLSKKVKINKINLRPFTFDFYFWQVNSCPEISIYYNHKRRWVLINTFEMNLNNEDIMTIYLNSVMTKGIKITTQGTESIFSLSYINIF
jgi:hypothetical protein